MPTSITGAGATWIIPIMEPCKVSKCDPFTPPSIPGGTFSVASTSCADGTTGATCPNATYTLQCASGYTQVGSRVYRCDETSREWVKTGDGWCGKDCPVGTRLSSGAGLRACYCKSATDYGIFGCSDNGSRTTSTQNYIDSTSVIKHGFSADFYYQTSNDYCSMTLRFNGTCSNGSFINVTQHEHVCNKTDHIGDCDEWYWINR